MTPGTFTNGGLFVSVQASVDGATNAYVQGFEIALRLIYMGVSLAVGLFLAIFVMHPAPITKRHGLIYAI